MEKKKADDIWKEVQKKYPAGTEIPNPSLRKFLVVSYEDDLMHFKWGPIFHGKVSKASLEQMHSILQSDKEVDTLDKLIKTYQQKSGDANDCTATAIVLMDMGYVHQ